MASALVTRGGDSTVTVLEIAGGEIKRAGRVQLSPSSERAIRSIERGVGNFDTVSLVDMRGAVPRPIDHATLATPEGVAMSPDSKLVGGGTRRYQSPAQLPVLQGEYRAWSDSGSRAAHFCRSSRPPFVGGRTEHHFSTDSRQRFVQNMVKLNVQVFRVDANAIVDTGERINLPGGGALETGAR